MGRYKVCVYAICKDEEQFVDRWMDSMSEADLVVVLDTGSKDKTVKKLKKRGARVKKKVVKPWRFDVARNLAMSYIPNDVDICVSVDLDEVLEKGWREKLEDVWEPSCTRASYLYNWSFNEDGTPSRQFRYEKIHRRFGLKWVHPVHEVLEYNGNAAEDKTVFVPGLILSHYPDASKSRGQYLPLLELSAEENPLDDRTAFWLGREYMYYKKYDLAIETLNRHLSLPTAVWNEERSASMRFIAECYKARGDFGEAKRWLYRAIAECPDVREPYLKMAQLGYLEENWPMVYAMAKAGLRIEHSSGSYLVDPECWGPALYDYAAISASYLGLLKEASELAEKACELDAGNERLKQNLELIKQRLSEVAKDESE